jgi:hypothetical protein
MGCFLRRIRWLLETELYPRLVRLDFVGQLGISPKESTRAEDAYILDSNSLFARFPWMTLADERILAEGWTRGAAWSLRSFRSESLAAPQSSSDVNSPQTKVSPPDSTPGRSNPLPLQE